MSAEGVTRSAAVRYGAWVLVAVAVGLGGYVGYVVYPRFDLPGGAGAGLVVLAAAAGVASFFSPCSFPLLVSILARPLSGTGTGGSRDRKPMTRALGHAAALSLGAVAFLVALGGALSLGAGSLVAGVTFASAPGRALRVAVGGAMVVLGLVQTGVLHVDLRRLEPAVQGILRRQADLRRRRPFTGFVLFGFVYLLAGFG